MPAARNRNPITSLRRLDCVGVNSLIPLADGRSQSVISIAENRPPCTPCPDAADAGCADSLSLSGAIQGDVILLKLSAGVIQR